MKKLIFCLSLFISLNAAWGQSYHFSQFFSTPLLTNPANTGFTEGSYRLASNIRTQGIPGNSFFTGYLSADFSLLQNKLTPGHKAGAGIYMMNDRSLNGAIQTNSVGMSAAYHVGLDDYGEHSFGLGVQGTYNQRTLDYSKLSFETQYGPGGFDALLPVGEPLNVTSNRFFDLNAGIVYNAVLQNKAFFAGFSTYNILRQKTNVSVDEFKMPARYTLQAGAQFYMGEYGKVYTSLTTMTQAKANEITVGGGYGLQLSDGAKNEIMGGLWYRYNDALIPYLGYQYNGFRVGISYDYTVSPLKTSAALKNGYELTLQYRSPDKRELKTHIPWY